MKVERKYVSAYLFSRARETNRELRRRLRRGERIAGELLDALDRVIEDPGNETWKKMMAVRKKAHAEMTGRTKKQQTRKR